MSETTNPFQTEEAFGDAITNCNDHLDRAVKTTKTQRDGLWRLQTLSTLVGGSTPTALARAAEYLGAWPLTFPATEGYAKAEVTLGGVDTRELSSKTMEARKVRGLFCIGEVVDVTGWLGGFNFQWAWASGHAAGQCV